jgi:hypothetical protein
MALVDVLQALEQHWDDVVARLDDAGRRRLTEFVEAAAAAAADPDDTDATTTAALDLTYLLLPVLPVGHPVERAIATGTRYQGPGVDARELPLAVAALRLRLAGPAAAEQVWQEARRRLLSAPSLTAHEVRARGQDPDLAGLIRLDADDGGVRLPAFQFDDRGAPRILVLEINRALGAEDDPWGVADWWLGANAWLAAVPAEVLGVVDDSVLIATAHAELGR